MKVSHICILLFTGAVFLSCRKVIEPKDLPQQDPRLVLNAVFTASYTIGANISISKSIVSGKDYKYVNNAVCEVYEDGIYLQNLKFLNNGNYAGSVAPKPNKKYMIKVAATGYEAISAETTVPSEIQTTPIERYDAANAFYSKQKYSGMSDYFISGSTKFRFAIMDDPQTDNYYSVTPRIEFLDSLGEVMDYTVSPYIQSYNNSSFLESQNISGSTMDVDDKNLVNGKEILINIGIGVSLNESVSKPIKSVRVSMVLQSISADYYKYKQTLIKQESAGISLFAEPVQVYSNVSNGMGIFVGSNTTFQTVYSGEIKIQ